MRQQAFEAKVLDLWTRTRIPLTRANLLVHTGASRALLDRMMDEMMKARLVELDSDDEGEILWTVRGAARPRSGPETIAELERRERLEGEVDRLTSGAQLALRAAGLQAKSPPVEGKKSLLASGVLSFFFGPIGWMYAAPLKEAIPAIIVHVLVCAILPKFFLVYLFGILCPVSAIAGILYAWSYNHEGRRTPLFDRARRALPPLRPR
ncbi:hypothetical protein [Chondromyces apiculatus]|uniref:Uncharacterized protein n=1 Tax=Chondromyces apiculatus DSM 436 TaxID=1192034 RepID=A0A017TA90_9BACT|nr:hypothetical protein [Chondromyces apiculatus]EYF06134.1 Hypothetical protein CAP_2324 [Chondromyces apiculatus DSM 436]